ncbi:MAG: hypothetical protein ACXWBQ_01230 [Usitatibacter sp.]
MNPFLRRIFVLLAFPGLASATVVEFYDAGMDRYFLTASPDEIAYVEGGAAGRTWVRTGYDFETQGSCVSATTGPCVAKPVCRFHDTSPLGSGSHFYTADEEECNFVRANYPGWTFEGIGFDAFVPEPSTGQCPRGTSPVYRTYNHRLTHRYTWDPAARDRMVARGWVVEGVAFCATSVRDQPLRSFALRLDADRVRSGPACADVIEELRSCVGPNNLPAPANKLGPYAAGSSESAAFAARTGLDGGTIFAVRGGTPEEAAADAFVQLADADTFGLHVATASRLGPGLTNVNPLFQFSRFDPKAGEPDDRLTPWAGQYDTEVEVALFFDLRLKRVAVPAGSAAYGHPTLSLFDRRSGVHFYFIVMTYGTVGSVDNVLRDGGQGDVIVSTAFRDSPFGRNFATAQTMATPASFESPSAAGSGGHYEYRFGRDEFRHIIAAARTLEPALSTDPADYLFDDYHFNNEIAGDGEIGLTLGSMGLKLLRR